MPKTNIRRLIYHARHHYLTMNNIVIGIALIIAAGWAWGSVSMMQRNYALQKEVDTKSRQLQLVKLQTQTLAYEQNYYKSDEYRQLKAKEYLGLAAPGESVLILPKRDVGTTGETQAATSQPQNAPVKQPANFQQWVNFLLGGNRHLHE